MKVDIKKSGIQISQGEENYSRFFSWNRVFDEETFKVGESEFSKKEITDSLNEIGVDLSEPNPYSQYLRTLPVKKIPKPVSKEELKEQKKRLAEQKAREKAIEQLIKKEMKDSGIEAELKKEKDKIDKE